MTAATITAAGNLTTALADERDPWHKRLALIAAVEAVADAFDDFDDGDTFCAMVNFANELREQLFADAQAVLDRNEDEREADRYGGFIDTLRLWDDVERARLERDRKLRIGRAA